MTGTDMQKIIRSIVRKIRAQYSGEDLEYEDIESEGYLIACEAMKTYDPRKGASVSTYIYQEVDFKLRNYVSRDIMKNWYGIEGSQRVDMKEALHATTEDDHETRIDLMNAREKMDDTDKYIFDHILEGYTYKEIGALLNVSTSAIGNRVTKWGPQSC